MDLEAMQLVNNGSFTLPAMHSMQQRPHRSTLVNRQNTPLAIECKWRQSDFDADNLMSFRRQYPEGVNLVVTSDSDRPFTGHYKDITFQLVDIKGLIEIVRSFDAMI